MLSEMPFVLLPFEANVLMPIRSAEGIKVVSVIFAGQSYCCSSSVASLQFYFADSGAKTGTTGHSLGQNQ